MRMIQPDLTFEGQRQALAQAAEESAVNNNLGQTMQAAQGLIKDARILGRGATKKDYANGITPEVVEALRRKDMEGFDERLGGLSDQINSFGAGSETSYDTSKFAPQGNMAALIAETAAELQMDPVDLATAISYETGGSFDPMKKGPTTQWGQHKGLIQWGEPQAREYGVDWNDPVGSQLGAGKAISRYFKDRGWQPGMSGVDLYSIINAGAPGRHNASDANNGGAPGTVADKWNTQMGGHRQKALKMFGLA